MAHHQRKHHRRQRHVRLTWLYGLISAVVILAAVIGGCIVFFKVDQINVEGVDRYTAQEIIDVSGIKQGDNLYLLNKFTIIDEIEKQLTYVQNVTIRRQLPSTLNITVEEYTAAAAVQNDDDGQWWLVSSEGRLLERIDGAGDSVQVTGLTLAAPSEGTDLAVTEEQQSRRQAVVDLLTSLEKRELLDHTQSIALSDSGVVMEYDGRITVKMELSADFDYDVRALATVMEDYVDAKWSDTDSGTLDMTTEDGKPHLIKNAEQN